MTAAWVRRGRKDVRGEQSVCGDDKPTHKLLSLILKTIKMINIMDSIIHGTTGDTMIRQCVATGQRKLRGEGELNDEL